MLDVALLGTGGMMPLPGRWLASAMVRAEGRVVLIDCGEGTQIAARQHGFSFRDIEAILITHYHADHTGGIAGVLLSMELADRREPVLIAGPPGLRRLLEAVTVFSGRLPFEVHSLELQEGASFDVGPLRISCQLGDHWAPCFAYRLDLPRAPRFLPERARELGIPVEQWKVLQGGEAIQLGSRVIAPEDVLGPPRRGLSVAYVTDTRPTERLPTFLREVDLLICEATFADPAQADRAVERKHMLFREAGALAAAAGARRLWLTHFSPALTDPERWIDEARREFEHVTVGYDGLRTTLAFD
ncbi:MAG: ribonuclease Z [Chloroflexota bacterium]|nr:ribonuclease Z [Dehalococcoidia bacterium]MDW8253049.1 ribonuclease Z [Chloroflexota bacterium]